ncbi:LysR family transcriptional regulator [Kaarinaea lacus]
MSNNYQQFQRLDTRFFKAFLSAADTQNFTLAAQQAAMTQSGISQQIAKLEEQIKLPLFKRLGKKVILTETGEELVRYVKQHQQLVDDFFEKVRSEQETVEGRISYAMPPSCILSPHFPQLLQARKEHPDVELTVRLSANSDILQSVLSGDMDFGFVTEVVEHPLLKYDKYCDEEYILVGADETTVTNINNDNLLNQKYIEYPGSDVYFNYWVKHFYPKRKNLDHRSLYTSGTISTLEGAIMMVVGGLGLSVFPRHCVQAYIDQGELFEYHDPNRTPILNTIYIVTLSNLKLPNRVAWAIKTFKDMIDCKA